MAAWEETRIDRLEERINRLEHKERERRELAFRWIINGFLIAMIILTTVIITLAATHQGH
jgi:hypothetical protein